MSHRAMVFDMSSRPTSRPSSRSSNRSTDSYQHVEPLDQTIDTSRRRQSFSSDLYNNQTNSRPNNQTNKQSNHQSEVQVDMKLTDSQHRVHSIQARSPSPVSIKVSMSPQKQSNNHSNNQSNNQTNHHDVINKSHHTREFVTPPRIIHRSPSKSSNQSKSINRSTFESTQRSWHEPSFDRTNHLSDDLSSTSDFSTYRTGSRRSSFSDTKPFNQSVNQPISQPSMGSSQKYREYLDSLLLEHSLWNRDSQFQQSSIKPQTFDRLASPVLSTTRSPRPDQSHDNLSNDGSNNQRLNVTLPLRGSSTINIHLNSHLLPHYQAVHQLVDAASQSIPKTPQSAQSHSNNHSLSQSYSSDQPDFQSTSQSINQSNNQFSSQPKHSPTKAQTDCDHTFDNRSRVDNQSSAGPSDEQLLNSHSNDQSNNESNDQSNILASGLDPVALREALLAFLQEQDAHIDSLMKKHAAELKAVEAKLEDPNLSREWRIKYEQAHAANEAMRKLITDLQNECNELTARHRDSNNGSSDQDSIIKQQSAEIARLKEQLEQCRNAVDDLARSKEELVRAEKKQQMASEELARCKAEMSSVEQERDQLQDELARQIELNESNNETIKEAARDHDRASATEALKKELDEQAKQLQRCRQDLKQAKSDLEHEQQEREHEQLDQSTMAEELKVQMEVNAIKDERLQTSQDAIAQLETELTIIHEDNAKSAEVISQLKSELAAARQTSRRQSLSLNSITACGAKTCSNSRQLSKDLDKAREDAVRQQDIIEQLESEVANVVEVERQAVRTLQFQFEDQERDYLITIKRLEQDLELQKAMFEEQLAVANQNAAKYRQEAHRGRERIEVLEREKVQKAQYQIDNAAEDDDVRDQLNETLAEVNSLKSTITQHEVDKAKWRDELSRSRVLSATQNNHNQTAVEEANERGVIIIELTRALTIANSRRVELEAMIECQAWAVETLSDAASQVNLLDHTLGEVGLLSTTDQSLSNTQYDMITPAVKLSDAFEEKVFDEPSPRDRSSSQHHVRAKSFGDTSNKKSDQFHQIHRLQINRFSDQDDKNNIANYSDFFDDTPVTATPEPHSASGSTPSTRQRSTSHQRSVSLQVPVSPSLQRPTVSSQRREVSTAVRRHMMQGAPISPKHQMLLEQQEQERAESQSSSEDF